MKDGMYRFQQTWKNSNKNENKLLFPDSINTLLLQGG